MTTDAAAAPPETESIPSDLALLGWTRRGTQLFAPGIPLSICMRSFPPPECFNVARDQPWWRAEISARWADAKKPKVRKERRKPSAPREPVQEEMLI
jgi:hypothetical protein